MLTRRECKAACRLGEETAMGRRALEREERTQKMLTGIYEVPTQYIRRHIRPGGGGLNDPILTWRSMAADRAWGAGAPGRRRFGLEVQLWAALQPA